LNRWLGGHACSLYGIEKVLARRRRDDRPLRLLDVGSGGGELAPIVSAWAARRGWSVDFTGLDDDRAATEYARRHHASEGARFVCDDLFEHQPAEPYDVVHMGITLHHFDGEAASRALRRMAELVRSDGGVVVNDLQRHPVPFYAVQLVTAALRSPAYVQHDAPLSVNRAFTREELVELAKAAGWSRVDVAWRPMFRWVLTGR
jgi:2-polyprenyl-3-methyl-5-hydroxy-6-metoxy-1,4-benzoquinol methylase